MSRIIYIFLFSLLTFEASSQVMQVNTTPGGLQFRAVKADTMLIVPRGDTVNIGATKWGVSTNGSLMFRNADTALYVRLNNRWYKVSGSGSGGGSGSGITNISYRPGSVVDTLYYTDGSGDSDWYWVVVRDGLLSGGIVTYAGTARTYFVSAAVFRKNGQFYTTNDTTITLPALASVDSSRSDVFVVDTTGVATTIQGVESANPLTPQINADKDVYLTHVTLTPARPSAGLDTVLIYDQNAEWTGSTGGTITATFNNTTNPYRGTLVTNVSSVNSGGYVQYANGSALSATTYDAIGFFIRLNSVMSNNANIFVSFWNGSTQVSNEVAVPITKGNTTTYQGFSLGINSFTFSNQLFDRVRFRYAGSGGAWGGYRLDFVYLQTGMNVTPPPSNFVQDVRRTGDVVEQRIGGVYTQAFTLSDKLNATDTASLSNRINLKLNISDTATMLQPYLRKGDTTAMLLPYLRKADTTSLSNRINLKLNISDTATMLANYIRRVFRNPGTDSVYVQTASGNVFAFRDSIGGGGSGVTTVGAFSASAQTNGATISGNTITFGPASSTVPGMVSTGTQTFSSGTGAKTFSNTATGAGDNVLIVSNNSSTSRGSFVVNNDASNYFFAAVHGSAHSQTHLRNQGYMAARQDLILAANADIEGVGSTYSVRIFPGGYGANSEVARFRSSGLKIQQSNSTDAVASALLELSSTTKGFLTTRMTSTQRNAISSPAEGLQVYNSTDKTIDVYDGTRWENTPNGLKGSATLDFGSTAAQSSADLTITVTGSALNDMVMLGVPNGSVNANTCFTAWVSAANTVTVRHNNYSSAAVDPASGTFRVYVIKN